MGFSVLAASIPVFLAFIFLVALTYSTFTSFVLKIDDKLFDSDFWKRLSVL